MALSLRREAQEAPAEAAMQPLCKSSRAALGPRGLMLQCLGTVQLIFRSLKTELVKSIWKSKC